LDQFKPNFHETTRAPDEGNALFVAILRAESFPEVFVRGVARRKGRGRKGPDLGLDEAPRQSGDFAR
jgi:hypothetical protein